MTSKCVPGIVPQAPNSLSGPELWNLDFRLSAGLCSNTNRSRFSSYPWFGFPNNGHKGDSRC